MSEQSNKQHDKKVPSLSILGRGFRPFFLLGAIYSALSLFIWAGFYAGFVAPPEIYSDPTSWHAHEMIYGFTMAIVAGFLLTAVANWTATAPTKHFQLATLCALWLAGRFVMNIDIGLPMPVIIVIEALFIPALAISLSIPLLRNWNKRNFVFLVLLSVLFICDLVFLITGDRTPLYVALMIVITMISLIGGRIIPAFTVAAIRQKGVEVYQTPQMRLDIAALVSLAMIMIIIVVLGTSGLFLAALSFVSFVIHSLRMRRYHTTKILNDPLVWILHVGYGWTSLGILLIGCAALGIIPFSIALHTLTVGAIGSMTLGMMCRVALGHTGRRLIANRATVAIFILIQISAISRILGPIVMPEYHTQWIITSASLWSLCFALYGGAYAKILWTARPDGRPA